MRRTVAKAELIRAIPLLSLITEKPGKPLLRLFEPLLHQIRNPNLAKRRTPVAENKIRIENLTKIFGPDPRGALKRVHEGESSQSINKKGGHTVAVRDVNFSVKDGEIFVIMGLSGSGKSTLVRMFNRLIEPTEGRVMINGRDVISLPRKDLIALRRKDMGMVFQTFALLPFRTVLENVAFGLEVAKAEEETREKRAEEALESVGLTQWADSYPGELSGGMRQRVGLARALAVDPGILLMDEAFSALDPLIRTEMQDELVELQQAQQRTVVFISHDLDEAMRIGDRIAIMESGRIVQVGTPDDIVQNPADDYVASFFREANVTQVFNAGHIAHRRLVPIIERPGTTVPTALQNLREHNREQAIIVDRKHRYLGTATAETLIEEMKGTTTPSLENAFLPDVEPVSADTPLAEVLNILAESRWDLPVVDENKRYKGTITKTDLLKTLNRPE